MKNFRRAVSLFLLVFIVFTVNIRPILAENTNRIKINNLIYNDNQEENNNDVLQLTSKSAVLMEASTGTILYDKNCDEILSPASITKIMTLILIFDAISEGHISLGDEVLTSEYAKSMGGSQVYLETGEKQTVETLIKCIVVASGNDASVALAEYIAGSELAFVDMMNVRANELGMTNTHFVDCCGLTESDDHYTTARDVAIMSRELITKYPEIKNYSSIWMENITHITKDGAKEFGLSNTNKLLKQYTYTTGLKTGSTSKAKYCVSATACKDEVELIAVVMAADDYKIRFSEAKTMLEYGYSICKLYRDNNEDVLQKADISGGTQKQINIIYSNQFSYICKNNEDITQITKEIVIDENVIAPIEKGDVVGKAIYSYDGVVIGEIDIIADEKINKADYKYNLLKIIDMMI